MENIHDMLERVHYLEDFREKAREAAVQKMQADLCAFVANYGYLCTKEYPYTNSTYVRILREGLILRKKKKTVKIIGVRDLTLEEMESIKKFMVDTLNNDIQYHEDEINRYTGLNR